MLTVCRCGGESAQIFSVNIQHMLLLLSGKYSFGRFYPETVNAKP